MKRRRSRLRGAKTRRLLEHVVAGTPARTAAELVEVNRNTATHFYHRLREIIAAQLAQTTLSGDGGEVEVHECYFGSARMSSTGHARKGDAPVFGLLTRGGKVHTCVVPSMRLDPLLPILRNRLNPDSLVYTDASHVSDVLHRLGMRCRTVNQCD